MSDRERVEALAKVILAERLTARELPNDYMDDAQLLAAMEPRAQAILASDWLRDLLAEAKADALTDLADDIDPNGYGWTSVRNAEHFKARIRQRAATYRETTAGADT